MVKRIILTRLGFDSPAKPFPLVEKIINAYERGRLRAKGAHEDVGK
ncbi:MAG: hypothetical protein KAI47_01055 [Deltaproteobacteria bacterium]|nr:hypothetical protein [Deltaproteobacteria bacterium]